MPELPEVETVRRAIAQECEGAHIIDVVCHRRNLRQPLPKDFEEILHGKRILRVQRRAKYLLVHLEAGVVLIVHLGMSGKWLIHLPPLPTRQKHDHVVMQLDNGKTLVFNDPRRFGLMALSTEAGLATHPLLAHLGPEPLGEAFTADYLYPQLKRRKCTIKAALMDQELVVGVGNIYASEALFLSRISPKRVASRVTRAEAARLVPAIWQVLEAAIASGGSTLRDYVRSTGDAGYFQHHFQVYGREEKPCFVCGTPIRRITQQGRSSFYCPHCQK